jgi:glucan 1,3-beta-glucosidase
VTYTNETVGGLPVIGLFSKWDDSASANDKTPAISDSWGSYADTPARGVNLGGWLSIEPFITPSLFNYDSKLGIIDEWTLTSHLGASGAKSTLEKHYATFVSEQTFIDIANAGLDHVRIPFSYWAVTTYDGDPYVFRTSWRYLLRGIEWARKHGLRISLDLHGLPGSQNGWNHSGRQGVIGWLNGTDGALNAQRSIDMHNQLSQFFAQDRYKDIIAFYGLANEPRMTALPTSDVLNWTTTAHQTVRNNGINAFVVFGDGFEGLANWKGKLQGESGLLLDVHQYVIFNAQQIVYNHTAKISYACTGWTQQAEQSMSTSTGFGPTIFMEWSQADTDCAPSLNNVGVGSRWEGSFASGDPTTQVLSPDCPTKNSQCSCDLANGDPGGYSDEYKSFLLTFAEAQMESFEKGWGWFYWTWATENATQWSYQLGLAAGILPEKAYDRNFNCSQTMPSFGSLPEYY